MAKEEKNIEEEIKEEVAEATGENTVKSDAEVNEEVTEENPSEENASEENASEENASEEGEKKKLFGKNKETQKLKEQIDELNDRYIRQMAEFENFRKRTEKEKQQMFETGAKSVIEKMLPVVDNFERGLAALSDEEKEGQFAQGVMMVYKQLMDELEKMEVKPIEAVGKEFDPNLHNAVMHIEDENLGENVIAQELQKGYTYRDTVVRYSMVQVAN